MILPDFTDESFDVSIDCVIIAGMGGCLIKQILENNFDKLNNVKRLILQANKDEFKLRKYLCNNGFYINNQKIIKEDNKFYEIDVFEKGKKDYTFEELYFGKILMEEKNDIFIEKWKLKYQKYQNYQKHKKTDMDNKIIEYMEKIICK